jgi:hypothetical protein
MTDITSFNLLHDWTELKPLELLQYHLERLVGKFDYAHPNSEQNRRKFQFETVRSDIDREKDKVAVDTNEMTHRIDEFIKTEWPDLAESSVADEKSSRAISTQQVGEDSETSSEEGLVDLRMKEKSVEYTEEATDDRPMYSMDNERDSIVDRELQWEKEHDMEPPDSDT